MAGKTVSQRALVLLLSAACALAATGCSDPGREVAQDEPVAETPTPATTATPAADLPEVTTTPALEASPVNDRCDNQQIPASLRGELEALTTTLEKGSVYYGRCGEREFAEGTTETTPLGHEYFAFTRRSPDSPWLVRGAGSGDPRPLRCDMVPRDLISRWHGAAAVEVCEEMSPEFGAGAGNRCVTEGDGAELLVMELVRGSLDCSVVEGIWGQYRRRAPTEGTGSGAYMDVNGWVCGSAPAATAPQLGSCEGSDQGAKFVVSRPG